MKLKVGDKVRIRKDLKVDKRYADVRFAKDMLKWAGKTVTISIVDNEGDFMIKEDKEAWFWSKEMFEPVNSDKLIFRDNATILLKDGKRYVTKCQSGDTYDREKGLLLCLAKANGYNYKDICEMLNNAEVQGLIRAKEEWQRLAILDKETKSHEVKEVKRSAKVGEYIKIVKVDSSDDCYNNGEIYEVIELDQCRISLGVYINTQKTHSCCMNEGRHGQSFVFDSEYVVLENYNPYKITLSEFWASKGKKEMAIYCKTEAETRELLTAFDRVGKKWSDGSSYIDFDKNESLLDKCCYYNNNTWSFYKNNSEIYEFNEVDLSK